MHMGTADFRCERFVLFTAVMFNCSTLLGFCESENISRLKSLFIEKSRTTFSLSLEQMHVKSKVNVKYLDKGENNESLLISAQIENSRPKRQLDRLLISLRMKNLKSQENETLGRGHSNFSESSVKSSDKKGTNNNSDQNKETSSSSDTSPFQEMSNERNEVEEISLSPTNSPKNVTRKQIPYCYISSENASSISSFEDSIEVEYVNCQDSKSQKGSYQNQRGKLWGKLGMYNDTYFNQINKHWLSFDPACQVTHYVLAVMYGVGMIVGCGGNALVIYMFCRCRSLRTPPNYLIANLALSDFLMMAKAPIFIINSLYGGPVLGAIGCKIYGFVGGLSGTTSIMTLACIAIDRYYVIVHPLNPYKRITFRTAIFLIIGVWLYSSLFASLPLFGVNNYTSEGYLTSCSFDYLSEEFESRLFVFIFFIAAWVFPLSIICFSYLHIFLIVRSAENMEIFPFKGRGNSESFRCRQDDGRQTNEVKVAVLSGIIISLWLLAWTPYAIVALMGIFGWKDYITPFVSVVPALFCKTASCIDPFVYAINHPRFRKELKAKFKPCCGGYRQQRISTMRSSSAETCRIRVDCDDETRVASVRNKKCVKSVDNAYKVSFSNRKNSLTKINHVQSIKERNFKNGKNCSMTELHLLGGNMELEARLQRAMSLPVFILESERSLKCIEKEKELFSITGNEAIPIVSKKF